MAEIKAKLTDLQSGRSIQDATVALQEAALEKQRTELIGKEQDLSERQKTLNAYLEESRKLETDLRLEKERQQAAQNNLNRINREAEETERRKGQLAEQKARIAQQIEESLEELRQFSVEVERLKNQQTETRSIAENARTAFQSIDQEERRATRTFNEKRNELERLKQKIELYDLEKVRLERESAGSDENATQRSHLITEFERKAKETREQATAAKEILHKAEVNLELQNKNLAQLNEQLRQAERKKEAAVAEGKLLENLVASYEEFSDTIQYLVKNATWTKTKPQTVADVLSVPAPLRSALEAGLGDLAGCFVVENIEEAQNAIAQLEKNQKGQATFLLLNRIQATTAKEGSLAEEIQTADKFRPLANLILGNVMLANSLAEAEEKSVKLLAKFVTKAGAWADGRGLLFGGSAKKGKTFEARIQRREQLEDVKKVRAEFSEQVESLLQQIRVLRQEIQQTELPPLKRAAEQAERAAQDAEKQVSQLHYETQVLEKRQTELKNRLNELSIGLNQDKSQIDTLTESVRLLEEAQKVAENTKQSAENKMRTAELQAREASTHFN